MTSVGMVGVDVVVDIDVVVVVVVDSCGESGGTGEGSGLVD